MNETRQNVLDAIGILRQHLGYPPTINEIARFTGQHRTTAYHHIRQLQTAGLVTATEYEPRSIRLTDAGRASLSKVVAL